MSQRSIHNRNLLLTRVALLALAYAVPLGGLALFFEVTDLRTRIAGLERERAGVRFIHQLIEVDDRAIREKWGWESNPARLSEAIGRLEELERNQNPGRRPSPHPAASDRDLTPAHLRSTWQETQGAGHDPSVRNDDLTLLIGQVEALLAQTSDSAGLSLSPDLETEAMSDLIAAALPAHLEHLLQMHEHLVAAEQDGVGAAQLARLFRGQLGRESARLARTVSDALKADANSSSIAAEFQRDYPPAAATFDAQLVRLRLALSDVQAGTGGGEAALRRAYEQGMAFWRMSATSTDGLIAGQIDTAVRERNLAVAVAVGVLVTLLPLTWLYFRRYLRPVVQDLLMEVQEAADAAARMKNQFLAMMSHEIRTPMNGVIGFANLLADTKLDEQQRDFVRTITASSESLLTIINDILDYTKLEAGRVELETRPVPIHDVVDEVVGLLSPGAAAKHLELICWVEPDVPEVVLTDPTRLRQVLLNLAGNAVKFTATGHVELSVQRAPAAEGAVQLGFHVRDTGIGIPADRLDRLFRPFSQVDASITRTHGGTGLGLAISHRLVTALGGKLTVASAVGKGTEFAFSISVRLPSPAAATPALATAPAAADGKWQEVRVLVVDDYPANRHLLLRMLEQHGAKVRTVESAAAARKAVAAAKFDLGIFDYMMPETDGITLARELAPQFPPSRLVLVTSVSLAPSAEPPPPFAAAVTKPIRPRKFMATLEAVLAGGSPAEAPATAAGGVDGSVRQFARQHPLRILAVDDNPVNLRVISMLLTSLGYVPAVLADGAATLTRLQTEKFDLVLMDVQMPEIDGLDVTRRLRRGEAGALNQRTRVLALTAGATAEERAACVGAGMDDFLPKPITRGVLVEALRASIAVLPRSAS
ncbi:MAG TPA: response regulator [Opitutaceae bacterium]|nr:response regulator [Opitutaceae bacterium]